MIERLLRVAVIAATGISASLAGSPAAAQAEGPVVLEFRVEQEDAVYPMVPQGAALHEMIRRPVKEKA